MPKGKAAGGEHYTVVHEKLKYTQTDISWFANNMLVCNFSDSLHMYSEIHFCVLTSAKKAKSIYQMAERVPEGQVLRDLCKGEWKIGKPIGSGGFGLIYMGIFIMHFCACQWQHKAQFF